MEEIWKKIEGQQNYEISNLGRVRSLPRMVNHWRGGFKKVNKRILKTHNRENHYTTVMFGDRTTKTVHRLVAHAFIPNIENKPCVNHLDGNKHNPIAENLEWCTYAENEQHSFKVLGKKVNGHKGPMGLRHADSIPVEVYDLQGNLLKRCESGADAARFVGGNTQLVWKVCRGERSKHKNHFFKAITREQFLSI